MKTAELRDLDDETAAAEIGALLLRLGNRSAEDLHADISELLPMARGADAAAVKAMSKLVIDKPAEADPTCSSANPLRRPAARSGTALKAGWRGRWM